MNRKMLLVSLAVFAAFTLSGSAYAFQTADMVLIPSGSFNMGDPFAEGNANELPVHAVYLDAFWIDIYEVTNQKYCQFLNASTDTLVRTAESVFDNTNAYEFYRLNGANIRISWNGSQYVVQSGYETHPVTNVTWYGASAYANYTGKRLPTEAEWEKAARGGLSGNRYPSGDTMDNTIANYLLNINNTTITGNYPAGVNAYGLYDAAGNVWEWCSDWYGATYYSSGENTNPSGPGSGSAKVARGGSWYSFSANELRCSYRNSGFGPTYQDRPVGFRCAGGGAGGGTGINNWEEYIDR